MFWKFLVTRDLRNTIILDGPLVPMGGLTMAVVNDIGWILCGPRQG
jgi:hypothetical protein